MKVQFKILLLVVFLGCFVGCKNATKESESTASSTATETVSDHNKGQAFIEDEGGTPNALQLAVQSKDHTTLVTAVKAAGVENALVNVGPLTVFAPTNEAFSKVDKSTLDNLLKPENKGQLALILTNHVAPSNYPVEMLKKNAEKNRKLYMASGEYVEVTEREGNLYVGDAKIIGTVNVSNGWVHVVDNVILPKK